MLDLGHYRGGALGVVERAGEEEMKTPGKRSLLIGDLLLVGLGGFMMFSACRPKTESVLATVLGNERSLVSVQKSGAQEGVVFGDSAYVYCLATQGGLNFLQRAHKSQFRDDLAFAKAIIQDLLKQHCSEEEARELFRTTVDGWKVYALTGTNQYKIYLLVLTM